VSVPTCRSIPLLSVTLGALYAGENYKRKKFDSLVTFCYTFLCCFDEKPK
jgi:hypothetical protein